MFIPHSPSEREAMLAAVGVKKIEDLFEAVPEARRFPKLDIHSGLSEMETSAQLKEMAGANFSLEDASSFLGAGAYRHYIPAAIDNLISRGEFYTAYTPYQPEIAQGTLQAIFEYQSLIARLTGMDVSNASHYSGATACAEAGILAYHHYRGKRKKILVSAGLNLRYQDVMRTYLEEFDGTHIETPATETLAEINPGRLAGLVDDDTALVMVQYPDFFGQVYDFTALAEAVHSKGALFCVSVNPIALGLLKTPGEMGADIVVGEGQPLGIPISLGGPYLGLFATRKELVRKMAGRIAGETVDSRGQRGYVLTLTAREQHIRRDKATSNICTNQGLTALTAAIYLSLLGKEGLRSVARLCYDRAHYAAEKIAAIPGFKVLNSGSFFHEFVVSCPNPVADLNEHLLYHNILGGYDLSKDFASLASLENAMLVAVTEMNSKEDIDEFCHMLAGGDHDHHHE